MVGVAVLALALLVLWLYTDHAHNAVALDDLAVATDFLYGCTNFHFITPLVSLNDRSL